MRCSKKLDENGNAELTFTVSATDLVNAGAGAQATFTRLREVADSVAEGNAVLAQALIVTTLALALAHRAGLAIVKDPGLLDLLEMRFGKRGGREVQ